MPKIIAETEDLLVIDKPAGLIVHSDGRTMEPSLADWVAQKYPKLKDLGEPWVSPQGESISVSGIVHRLDRTTSGVVLVAKNQKTFDYLRDEFKNRRVEKIYKALVYGRVEGEGKIIAEIVRTSDTPKRWAARPTTEDDKRAAITLWRSVRSGHDVSLLELRPLTGRTHQIRVHLASIGHGVVSDHLYAQNSPQLLGFTRPALHAESISLTLPSGERINFSAPHPDLI